MQAGPSLVRDSVLKCAFDRPGLTPVVQRTHHIPLYYTKSCAGRASFGLYHGGSWAIHG